MTDAGPQSFATELALKAARSVGCRVAELVRRTKSQAYLFGRLRKAYPDRTDEELRAVVDRLRWSPPPEPELRPRMRRAPIRGREPATAPCWVARAERLAAVVRRALTTEELYRVAQAELRWRGPFIAQTLSASEDLNTLYYVQPHWLRLQVIAMPKTTTPQKPKKVTVQPVVRKLPCPLADEDRLAHLDRIKGLRSQRRDLDLQLQSEQRRLRAALADVAAQIEATQAALDQGTELRDVACEERWNWTAGTVETVRRDTKAIIDKRDIKPEERQDGLFDGQGAA